MEFSKNDIINTLASLHNTPILEVTNPLTNEVSYFTTGDFRPASNEAHFHELRMVYDVTVIINNASDINRTVTQIKEKQSSNNPINKKFDKNFLWKWNIS